MRMRWSLPSCQPDDVVGHIKRVKKELAAILAMAGDAVVMMEEDSSREDKRTGLSNIRKFVDDGIAWLVMKSVDNIEVKLAASMQVVIGAYNIDANHGGHGTTTEKENAAKHFSNIGRGLLGT